MFQSIISNLDLEGRLAEALSDADGIDDPELFADGVGDAVNAGAKIADGVLPEDALPDPLLEALADLGE